MSNPPVKRCNVTNCDFSTAPNNKTIDQVLKDLELHMEGHRMSVAQEQRELQQQQIHRQDAPAQGSRNVLQKQRPPPIYGKDLSFEDYVDLLNEWDHGNMDPAATKQHAIIDNLQKNSHRSTEAAYLSANASRLKSDRTVQHLITTLREKFELSEEQKFDNLVKRMLNFKPDSKEDLLTEGDRVAAQWTDLKVNEKQHYFIRRWITEKGKENNMISSTESREIENKISAIEDSQQWSEYKKNFKKVMIDSDPNTIETNYNNSYRRFRSPSRDYKNNGRNSSSSGGRSRSFSRQGRDSSRQRRDRPHSGTRPKDQPGFDSSLKGKIDKLIEKVSGLEKKLNNLSEKEKVVDTHFSFDHNIQIINMILRPAELLWSSIRELR